MDKLEYKEYHEKFMQNHNGSTPLDVFLTIAPSAFTPWLANHLISLLQLQSIVYKVSLEFILITVPIVLSTTLLSQYRYLWFFVTVILFLYFKLDCIDVKKIVNLNIDRRKKWSSISCCRALTGLITAHCILAVDFKVFPRYFAKTEQFGCSLMDTGVGLYVFCNALVPTKVSRHSLMKSIEMNIKPCFVLMLLGILRSLIVKEIDYQQHLTEYGVHWNFFITLGVTKFASTVVMSIFKENNSLICGVILLIGHEFALQKYLLNWVFSNMGRYDFVTANREGLVSCPGYVALYLISVYVGQTIREKYREKNEGHVISSLFTMIIIFWVSVYLTQTMFGVSRCLANMGYCCFVIAIGVSMLTICYILELVDLSLITNKRKINDTFNVSNIFGSINNNGLFFFMLANIFTGIINLSMQTLFVEEMFAVFILLAYLSIIITIVVIWEHKLK